MLTKLATAVIYLLVGVGLGYIVWGARVGHLTESLNHMVLEEDSLQSRLLGASADDSRATLAAALDDLAEQLRDQSERIARQAEAIEGITGEKTSSLKGELSACADRRARIEHDLEQCLFDKAALARQIEAAVPVPPPPRSGTSPVERTVTYPGMVDATKGAAQVDSGSPPQAQGKSSPDEHGGE